MRVTAQRCSIMALALSVVAWLGGCPLVEPPSSDVTMGFNVSRDPTPVITEGVPVFESQPIFEATADKTGSHAPTIASFSDGELLAAWYAYDGPGELSGAAIYTARRPAGGQTWEAPALHIDRPEADANPVLYAEGDRVWLFCAVVPGSGWSTAHIEIQQSLDRGVTWSAPRCLVGPLGSNVRFAPVRTADGTLLLPAYDDLLQRSLFFTSADGEAWTLRSALQTPPPHQNLQPSVVSLRDGRVLAVLRNGGRGWLWVTASDDSGLHWEPPADSGFPNPGSPAALQRLASGNLILVYNDAEDVRRPLSVAISADEGETWYPPRVIATGEGAYAYPVATQTPDGLVHIVYSHNRQWIQHVALNEAWLVAGDGVGP